MKTEVLWLSGATIAIFILGLLVGSLITIKWDTYCITSKGSEMEGILTQRDHCAEMLEETTDWKVEFLESGAMLFYKDTAAQLCWYGYCWNHEPIAY